MIIAMIGTTVMAWSRSSLAASSVQGEARCSRRMVTEEMFASRDGLKIRKETRVGPITSRYLKRECAPIKPRTQAEPKENIKKQSVTAFGLTERACPSRAEWSQLPLNMSANGRQ